MQEILRTDYKQIELSDRRRSMAEAGNNTQTVISLELQEDLSQDSVSGIAECVAVAVGDSATGNIVIQGTEGTVLFE